MLMAAGIILTAVGDEHVIGHPTGHLEVTTVVALFGGPCLFFSAQLIFTRNLTHRAPRTRILAVSLLLVAGAVVATLPEVPPLIAAAAAASIIVAVATDT